MSEYTHRMTLAVPETLMPQANQLALIAGESSDDDKTFTVANWQDKAGNKYAVCSAVIKPIVLSLLNQPVADSVLTAENADTVQAQQAMDKVVMYEQGMTATTDKIIIVIDVEPISFFRGLGLIVVETDLV